MREHTSLRVVFLWMVLLTFMDANPQAIKMGEDMGDPDPCRNIKTMNNDHECFRRKATGPTMGVSKDPMNEIHLCVHHCFSNDSKDKMDAGKDLTRVKFEKDRMLETLGKATDRISVAMQSVQKACKVSSADSLHHTLFKARAYVYRVINAIEKLDPPTNAKGTMSMEEDGVDRIRQATMN